MIRPMLALTLCLAAGCVVDPDPYYGAPGEVQYYYYDDYPATYYRHRHYGYPYYGAYWYGGPAWRYRHHPYPYRYHHGGRPPAVSRYRR